MRSSVTELMRPERGSDPTSVASALCGGCLPRLKARAAVGGRVWPSARYPCASSTLQGDLTLGTLSQQPQLLATLSFISSPSSEKVLLATRVRTHSKDSFTKMSALGGIRSLLSSQSPPLSEEPKAPSGHGQQVCSCKGGPLGWVQGPSQYWVSRQKPQAPSQLRPQRLWPRQGLLSFILLSEVERSGPQIGH